MTEYLIPVPYRPYRDMTPPDSLICRKIWLHTALLRAAVCSRLLTASRLSLQSGYLAHQGEKDATYELQSQYFSMTPEVRCYIFPNIYIYFPKSNIAETAPQGFDSSLFNLQIRIDIEGERETANRLAEEAGTTASLADQHESPFLSNYSTC